jgi:glycosyltransferase involved in cell wall biosynthesis
MRIVIDMQGAQSSGSRHRGIGRYTHSLSKAIVRNGREHEIILVLNGLFPESIESIRANFDTLLPQESIRVWYAPHSVNSLDSGNTWRRQSAELVREAFLVSLKPDIILVTSLFEGLNDDAVTSIGILSKKVPTVTILYDLIPLINRKPYLENPVVEAWYENKLDHLRRSDLLLAISESSRQEGVRYLGFVDEMTVNISTAADHHFQPQSMSSQQEATLRERYKLHRPYVMYTGGIDHRKNIEGLIRAYAILPQALRTQHQLAIVCSIQPYDKVRLEELAKTCKLEKDEIVLTGFIPENDLLALYGLCKLFVFPSRHEGFGLPALEAMSCGKAVIGANASSVPEVIGRDDALFDPRSDESIAAKLTQVLTDEPFRLKLEKHGLEQAKKFSWDKSAICAIAAFESLHAKHQQQTASERVRTNRPKLAFISPLPPERSGISYYSAELLPELSRHYEIDVIVDQQAISDPWINANCQIRNVEWFRIHAERYDRVLYHFGNSHFHQHMFKLLEEIPGVVVLHDFFLSGIVALMDSNGSTPNCWEKELYKAHGYHAIQERFHAIDTADVVWKYPCNLSVLSEAQGVIVHSENAQKLVKCWHTSIDFDYLSVIPLLREPALNCDRTQARQALNLKANDFVICSFGLLNPAKLNHSLLEAWLNSKLSKDDNSLLVFVGENNAGEYGQEMLASIRRSGFSKRIRITGWADTETFRHYLSAADVAVQLRTLSRGEASAAVLDCMNYGLPTIVNANGSMADLADDALWKLTDEFTNEDLVGALEGLWGDKVQRARLGKRAREIILEQHAPRSCTDQYVDAIERFSRYAEADIHSLAASIALLESQPDALAALLPLATAISKSIDRNDSPPQLFLDISVLVQSDAQTGIQRVVRSVLKELLLNPPQGMRVEPVFATIKQGYRYARFFTLAFLNCPTNGLSDEPIEYRAGDFFLGLDLYPEACEHKEFYQKMRHHGVQVNFVIYDFLCLSMPQYFVEDTAEGHKRWLNVVAESDGAVCISKAVADELSDWVRENSPPRQRPFNINWFHLGADVNNSAPSKGLPATAKIELNQISQSKSFLMVGTIEPRKGHAQVLEAFEQLWQADQNISLIIVGKQGWMVEELIKKLQSSPELNKRLFWLNGISDEYLEKVYAASTCLIAASYGEGFGLPLIEAAQHKLPIIARDIPVFHEVAGDHAYYFTGKKPEVIATAISTWLETHQTNQHPKSDAMPWLTWQQSAKKLTDVITK